MKKVLLVAAFLLPFTTYSAEENLRPFQPAGPVHQVAVTTTASTPVQVNPTSTSWTGCTQYKVENLGTTDFYIGFGATAADATTNTNDIPAPGDTGAAQLIRAGTSHVITNIPKAYIAAKTLADTSTMNVGCGVGSVTGVATGGGSVTLGAGSKVVITDGTEDATVRDTGVSDSLNVAIVDASGNQITSFGGAGSTTPTDNFANPTNASNSASFNFWWDGATWDRSPGNTSGGFVQGPVAHDAPASGNPLLSGGRASSTLPTIVSASGDAVTSWMGMHGQTIIGAGPALTAGDAVFNTGMNAIPSATGGQAPLLVASYNFNGTSWDRQRGNTTGAYVGAPTTGGDPCGATGVAKSSVAIAATADAELVALSGSTVIYVCGFNFTLNGTTPTARFQTGTGATCATGTVQETGVMAPTVGLNLLSAGGGYTVFSGAAGAALCINVGGTTPSAQGVLTYVQQ